MNGILNVYKEQGYTSFDVIARLRGILHQKKIGHTGTLDPQAEGVLPVCIGNATKVCSILTDTDKTYRTVLLLGMETDTQDTTGQVIHEKETTQLTKEQVRTAIMKFAGEYDQIPPMYSALKINGKKLYELAREGKTVDRKPRRVEIKQLQIEEMDLPRVTMSVTCSKGTYIRTLCDDIGRELDNYGCMEKLTRTRVGAFSISESLTLEQIEKMTASGEVEQAILSVERVFPDYKKLYIKEEAERFAKNGNALLAHNLDWNRCEEQKSLFFAAQETNRQSYRLYHADGSFFAIYEYRPDQNLLKPVKMFL